jgi:putative transposase
VGRRAPRNPEPARRWKTFLQNHRDAIAAMDFFTVPTLTFGVLYCFFIISHDGRRILHCNVTRHPTSTWVDHQQREAFPYDSSSKYPLFDRDTKFGFEVLAAVKSMGTKPVRITFRSPWQNGVADRGGGVAAAICSTMSSPATSAASRDSLPTMSATTTRIELT